jgi:hypothetical protein
MKTISLFLLLLLAQLYSNAQILVNNQVSDTTMAQSLIGSGVIISNIALTCPNGAYGTFNSAVSLGINSGIVLTSGAANSVIGPNSINVSTSNSSIGDVDLDTILINNAVGGITTSTNDACALEFDVTVQHDTLLFNYVFGSEEYEEFVASFNDVFALIITGPGIVGKKNIALIPNSNIPISINNVNCNSNAAYYVCNDANNGASCSAANCPANNTTTEMEYDGYTTVLTAIQAVIPNSTYHLKLVVADATDNIYDSGVFIQGYSLKSISTNQPNSSLQPDSKKPDMIQINNPIMGNANLKFYDNEPYKVKVFNSYGILIVNKSNVLNNYEIQMEGFASGVYLLEVLNSKGKKQLSKLIKQ